MVLVLLVHSLLLLANLNGNGLLAELLSAKVSVNEHCVFKMRRFPRLLEFRR